MNSTVAVNTCPFGVDHLKDLTQFGKRFGQDVGFEIMASFEEKNFEKNLVDVLPELMNHQISWHCPVKGCEYSAPKGTPEYEHTMAQMKTIFRFAKMTHSDHYVMRFNNCLVTPETKDDMLFNALENYCKVEDLFGQIGCRIYVENSGTIDEGTMLLDQDEFTLIVKEYDFDVLVDLGHAHANGWDIQKLVHDLKDQIWAFHLHNNDGRHDTHNRLQDGTLDYDEMLNFLAETAPGAEWVLEYEKPEDLGEPLREDLEELIAFRKMTVGSYQL